MTTQYTPTLKLALPVTGELSGTWGDVVNDNITSMIEQAIAGLSTINTWTANAHTLTTANGTTSESRCAMLVAATGAGGTAITGAGEIICPAAAKLYVLQNTTAFAITLKTSAGTGVAVAASNTAFLFCDGTNVNACVTTIVNGNITGNLTVGGNATINGNTTLGDATSDTITATARFNTDLLPSTDNARDLGSSANSWKDLYIDGTAYLALVDINGGTIDGVSIGSTTAATVINVDNLRLDGNTLSSTDSNGNIVIAPNGTGDVQLDADTVRIGDAAAAVTLTSNGAGALTVTTGGAADITISTNSGTTSGTITIANGANGNITLTPDGTGDVILSADRTQFGDSNTDTTLTTNGTGNLNLSTNNGTNSGTIQIAQGVNGNITLTPSGTGLVSIPSVTISGGTANGVTYLNASKVLTSGSVLVFDGTNLGVGIASPVNVLSVVGATGIRVRGANSVSDGALDLKADNTSCTINAATFGTPVPLLFSIDGTEKLRLTATSLYTASGVDVGIGTPTPGARLHVSSSGSEVSRFQTSGADMYLRFVNSFDTNGYIGYQNAAMTFWTLNTLKATLDSAGNLGLGVTPSAWDAAGAGGPILQIGRGLLFGANTETRYLFNTYYGTGDFRYIASSIAAINYQQASGQHRWFVDANAASPGAANTIVTFTQAMTLDSSGNLGVGETNPTTRLDVKASRATTRLTSSTGTNAVDFQANNTGGQLLLGIDSSTGGSLFSAGGYTAGLWYTGAYPLVFGTNNAERARITSDGYFKASDDGSYSGIAATFHEFNQSAASQGVLTLYGDNASTTAAGMLYIEAARNTTNNTYYAISYYNTGAAAYKFRVADSGDVTNTNNSYGAISDAKLKENVTDATPKLDKLNQVRIVNFNMIGDEQKQLGVIAQELEQIFPGMVDESPDRDQEGNDLGTTTKSVKYSVFVPMLIKAMQEQQAIITALTARVASLESSTLQ